MEENSEVDEADMMMDAFYEEDDELNSIECEMDIIPELCEVEDDKSSDDLKKNTQRIWFKVDSGASIHLKTSPDDLFDLEQCEKILKVAKQKVTVTARQKEKMKWYLPCGQFLILKDVFVIPNSRNLLNLAEFVRNLKLS